MFADAIAKLVLELLRTPTFDEARASVVADWCETTGLQGAASVLRSPETIVEKAEILYGIAHLILPFEQRLPEARFLLNVLQRSPPWTTGPNGMFLDVIRFIDSPNAIGGVARLYVRHLPGASSIDDPVLLTETVLPHPPRSGVFVVEASVGVRIPPFRSVYATTPLGWRTSVNFAGA